MPTEVEKPTAQENGEGAREKCEEARETQRGVATQCSSR